MDIKRLKEKIVVKVHKPKIIKSSPLPMGAKILSDAGNMPSCNMEQINKFSINANKVVEKIGISHLKKRKREVLHGGHSLNMLLPTYRESKDFDIFSDNPKKYAKEFEKKIDKEAGCNICQTLEIPLKKSVFLKPCLYETGDKIFNVRTPAIGDDGSFDLIERQSDLKTVRKSGITHEALEAQLVRAQRDVTHTNPERAAKAKRTVDRIELYLKSKGIK